MTQNFIDIIQSRGFVHQMTDESGLRELLKTPGQRAYIGFDCTAKSLHVGSLVQIMLLRWWQKCGHTPIVLLGGGTTKIGDPSGKDESRPKLDDASIADNMVNLKQVFSKLISFENDAALMVNNDDWLKDINYIDFLRDYGRHFSVNRMMTMDSVRLRLEREQPLSFLEFNYMILQAYDFVELNKRLGCRVQMGGSDQWGNIINGVDLNRRLYAEKHIKFLDDASKVADVETDNYITNFSLFGITSPLLTTASGAKMGKTAAGAIWLNEDLLKPYDYWQFWRNTEDGDVIRFLKLFTELSLEQIAEYEAWVGSAKINDAKIILATEATALLHGRDAAGKAAQTAADTFSGAGVSADLHTLSSIQKSDLIENGVLLRSYLFEAGWVSSNGEAKRLFEGGGIKLNDIKITDEKYRLSIEDFKNGTAKLSKKKDHVLLKVAG